MNKIRIIHCIETISSGGVEQVRLNLAKSLDFSAFDYKIICTKSEGRVNDELEALGVEIFQVGPFNHPFQWEKHRKVLKIIKNYKPHIIHGAVFEGMSMAVIGGILGRVPIILIEETSYPINRSRRAVLLQRLYAKFSNRIIAISPAVAEYLKQTVRVHPSKVVLLNNGVQLPRLSVQEKIISLKFNLGIYDNDLVIGAVGRIYNPIKRFMDILDAMHLIDNPNAKFLLVGTGPDLNMLKEKAVSLNLHQKFISVGYQADPNIYYSIMDVMIIPSAHEGFGLVAVEAMMHRLPVIATKVGGLRNIVLDQVTGFLINANSPLLIAEKINYLIDFPEKRKEMGERGYIRALENYTSDIYYRNLLALYESLINETRRN